MRSGVVVDFILPGIGAMCLLDHLYVVPCCGLLTVSHGLIKTLAVLIMKYMSEGSLRRVLNKVKDGKAPRFWNPTGIAIIVCGIVAGLEIIHSDHLIHRNIKPENFLLDKEFSSLLLHFLCQSRFRHHATRLSDVSFHSVFPARIGCSFI
jgi:serine/threonine protein kinase